MCLLRADLLMSSRVSKAPNSISRTGSSAAQIRNRTGAWIRWSNPSSVTGSVSWCDELTGDRPGR